MPDIQGDLIAGIIDFLNRCQQVSSWRTTLTFLSIFCRPGQIPGRSHRPKYQGQNDCPELNVTRQNGCNNRGTK